MLSLDLIVQPWGAFEGLESGQGSRALIGCRGWTEEARDWNNLPTAAVQVIEDTGLTWGRDSGVEGDKRQMQEGMEGSTGLWNELGGARTEMVMCLSL